MSRNQRIVVREHTYGRTKCSIYSGDIKLLGLEQDEEDYGLLISLLDQDNDKNVSHFTVPKTVIRNVMGHAAPLAETVYNCSEGLGRTHDEFRQQGAMLGLIIHLGSVCVPDHGSTYWFSHCFCQCDLFNLPSRCEDDSFDIFEDLPELKMFINGPFRSSQEIYPDPEAVSALFLEHHRMGFLVQGEVIDSLYKADGECLRWNSYYRKRKWFYAETVEEASQKILKWAKDVHKQARLSPYDTEQDDL